MARSIALVLALVGCACGEEAMQAPTQDVPHDVACAVVLSPHEVLRADVEAAAERWSAATGCEITVGEGGVPVHIVSSIVRPDGTQAPGMTPPDRSRVEINVRLGSAQRARTVMHELGHALGGDHVEGLGVLSGERGYTAVIDAVSLGEVCAHLACPAFNPEAQ